MDRQRIRVDEDHDDLEEIARPIRPDHEISRRVLTEFHPRDGPAEGMIDVVIAHTVSTGRRMDLHTLISVLRELGGVRNAS